MSIRVFIYAPSKTAMQSGRRKGEGRGWILEAVRAHPVEIEPLMGWPLGRGTDSQIRLRFPSCEAAIAFAKHKQWDYTVLSHQTRKIRPRNYLDNFKKPVSS